MADKYDDVIRLLNDLAVTMNREFERVHKEREDISRQIARIDGQLSILVTWMPSMDQRFTALMSPYNPPQRPAA